MQCPRMRVARSADTLQQPRKRPRLRASWVKPASQMVPAFFPRLKSLRVFCLAGTVPPEYGELSDLSFFNASCNQLTGERFHVCFTAALPPPGQHSMGTVAPCTAYRQGSAACRLTPRIPCALPQHDMVWSR